MEENKIENSIAVHQSAIKVLKEIKENVDKSETEKMRFKIETKHWYGYSEPHLCKIKNTIRMDKYTANVLLDTAINIEQERINKLIDMEIEKRKENKANE